MRFEAHAIQKVGELIDWLTRAPERVTPPFPGFTNHELGSGKLCLVLVLLGTTQIENQTFVETPGLVNLAKEDSFWTWT